MYENDHVPIRWALAICLNASPHIYLWFKYKRAGAELQGRVEEAWGKHSGHGKGGVRAKRHCPGIRQAAEIHSGMVRLGACSRFKLRALWLESDQRTFQRPVSQHNGQGPNKKRRKRWCSWRQTASASLTLSTLWARTPFTKSEWERTTVLSKKNVASLWVVR